MTREHESASTSATTPLNPTNLPSRYEIRKLTPADLTSATAILCESNVFKSTIFTHSIPPSTRTATLHAMHTAATYLVSHQIDSGLSYGVFDTAYAFNRPESRSTAGALYWDDLTASHATLLTQMDFPLQSVALSYDAAAPLDMSRVMPLVDLLPAFGIVYAELNRLDPRDGAGTAWRATGPGQVLMRNGTSTRSDCAGRGLMGALARWVMREVKGRGYRGIQIECLSDAVTHTWLHPPKPFAGHLVASFWAAEYEAVDDEGEKVRPMAPAEQLVTRVWVDL